MTSLRRSVWIAALLLSLAAGVARGDSRWVQAGPGGGQVQALAAAPSDSRVVYATAPTAVFRSLDGGKTWTVKASGDAAPFFAPGVLAVDPEDSGHVFAATLYSGLDFTPTGIFESRDAGATWSDASSGLPREGGFPIYTYQLAFNPHDPAQLYAVTGQGIFVRRAGDLAWQPFALQGDSVDLIAFDPNDRDTLLATLFSAEDRQGVFRSTDGGKTWTRTFNEPLYSSLVFDPSQPSRVYGTDTLLYRSLDGGRTWSHQESLNATALAVDGDGTLYAASPLNGVFRSRDAGDTWSPAPDFVHYRNRPLDSVSALLLQPGALLAGGSRGVWRSTDRAASWQASSAGFTAHSPQHLSASDGRVYFGDGTIFKSANDGATWKVSGQGLAGLRPDPQPLLTLFTPLLAASPSDPRVVYAHGGSQYDRFARTDDGGEHWHILPGAAPGGESVSQVVVDPTSPLTVYVVGEQSNDPYDRGCHSLKSTDGGVSWRCLGIEALQLAVHPAQPQVLMALGDTPLRSEDGGTSWRTVARGLPQDAEALNVALDPADPQVLWLGTTAGVFRSGDGGRTLRRRNQGLPAAGQAASLIVDPLDSKVLYAGFQGLGKTYPGGIYRSTDGGHLWARFDSGLPLARLTGEIALDSRNRFLFAATSEEGLWRTSLDAP